MHTEKMVHMEFNFKCISSDSRKDMQIGKNKECKRISMAQIHYYSYLMHYYCLKYLLKSISNIPEGYRYLPQYN